MDKKTPALAFLLALSTSALGHDDRPARYIAREIPAPELQDPSCVPGYATTQWNVDVNDRRFSAGAAGCYHDEGPNPDGQPNFNMRLLPYAWSPFTGSYLLPVEPNGTALALGVDVYGNAYGFQTTTNLDGVKWSPGGGASVVIGADPICGFGVSFAITANARGEIAGQAFRPVPEGYCNVRMLVRKPGGEEVLGPIGGTAAAINDAGLVAGTINSRAAKWNSRTGEVVMLRPESDTELSSALDMNERGVTVGQASRADGFDSAACYQKRALLWDARNRERELSGLPGSVSNVPNDINGSGVIVGYATPDVCDSAMGERQRAVVWSEGRVYDLNSLLIGRPGVVLLAAIGINERGEIVATGYRAREPKKPCPQPVFPADGTLPYSVDGACHDTHAYLLMPVD